MTTGSRLVMTAAVTAALAGGAVWLRPDLRQEGEQLLTRLGVPLPTRAVAEDPRATEAGRARGGGAPPVPVTLAEVTPHRSRITFSAIGAVQPIASIPLKPRLDSQVLSVAVAEGAKVSEGNLIMTLDDRTLRAQLSQIEGQIAKDEAQIAQAERDLARADELLKQKFTTPVARDTAATALAALKAQRAADLGQRENVVTQIGFTELRAPVSGRIGSIAAKAGAVVRAADTTPLAVINQIDPIYVSVGVPQALAGALREAMKKGSVPVTAQVAEAKADGVVAFVENAIDPTTGTLTAKARLQNVAETLWPGAFVRLTVSLGEDPAALTVPLAAVQTGQNGTFVFVAGGDGKVKQTDVTVARSEGDEAVIGSGIKHGDKVVTSGQLRLFNGAAYEAAGGKAQRADTAPADKRG